MEGSGVVTRERRNNMVPPPLVLTALRAVRTTVSAHRTCIVCLSASRGLATPKPASGGPANQGGLRPPNTQRGPPRPPGQPGNAGSRPNAPRPPPQKPQSGPRTPQQGAATRAAPAPPKPAASKRQPKTEDDGSELEAGQKNEEIDPNLVIMLIGTEGERLANMTAAEAMTLRESKADPELGLPDLLIVAARAKPPVARLVWPEPEKKPAAPQPKQVQKKVATVVKELEIYTSIARHDLMTKIERARQFFSKGYQVLFTVERKPVKRNQKQPELPPDVETQNTWEAIAAALQEQGIEHVQMHRNRVNPTKLMVHLGPPRKQA